MAKEIDVLEFIKKNPGTNVKEIMAQETITEITTKKILFDLLRKKLITYQNNGYYDTDHIPKENPIEELNKETFYGVYIKEEHQQAIKYLYNKITEIWLKNKNEKPKPTQVYKQVAEINNKLNLNLPIVWYKFGQIPVVSYDIDKEYVSEIDFSNKIPEKLITATVIENLKLNSREIKLKQYTEGKTNLHVVYLTKEKMIDAFYKNDFDYIKNNFHVFFEKIPYNKDESRIMDRFYDFVCKYNNLEQNLKNSYKYKDLFNNIFNAFWSVIAIQNFESCLKSYYKKNNIQKQNINYFEHQLKIVESEFIMLLELFFSDYYKEKQKSVETLLKNNN
jgi:hypothetical protein